jgi:hypothetical protein
MQLLSLWSKAGSSKQEQRRKFDPDDQILFIWSMKQIVEKLHTRRSWQPYGCAISCCWPCAERDAAREFSFCTKQEQLTNYSMLLCVVSKWFSGLGGLHVTCRVDVHIDQH